MWLEQHAGTVITVGGSIVVAVIGLIGMLWAKFHTPKQPIPIQDVWSENRSLRAELRTEEDLNAGLDRENRKLITALQVLWQYVQRVRLAWGAQVMPPLTPGERRTLAPHIEDLDTPGAGTPAVDTTT